MGEQAKVIEGWASEYNGGPIKARLEYCADAIAALEAEVERLELRLRVFEMAAAVFPEYGQAIDAALKEVSDEGE